MSRIHDYVIVGAGAAGCVLAARLSEDPKVSVMLVEAGPDTPPGQEPADILDSYPSSYFNKTYNWPGLKAAWRKRADGLTGFPQGRIMGGGGSLMGMISLRGTPADYAEWEAAGATGWGWDDVLPWFRKLEHDLDFDNAMHGQDGPMPIRRLAQDLWSPLPRAIGQYAQEAGIPFIGDMNGDFRDGYGAVPMCNTPERRASSALRYLTAEVRRRPNLELRHGTMARQVVFENLRATAVLADTPEGRQVLRGNQIIISGGGIFSPTLLMRSGIGDAAALQGLGIPVLLHRAGVGRNLQNHPILFIGAHLKKSSRQSPALRTHPSACFRYSSGAPGCAPGDLYINIQSKTSWSALGQQIGNLAPALLRPKSTGTVTLASSDPAVLPNVEFNFLSDPADLPRLMHAFARTVEIIGSRHVKGLAGTPFPVRFTDKLRQLNELNDANARKTAVLAGLLDILPPLSDLVLGGLTGERVRLAELVRDQDRLAEHITANVAGMFHPAGTCRMGAAEDPGAVVDPAGRVHGVSGLRVIDASVMPNLMAGNTNIPTIMLAEKMAAGMAAQP
jgi:5-(hydroxymethyl)furfural/furfural oxidase